MHYNQSAVEGRGVRVLVIYYYYTLTATDHESNSFTFPELGSAPASRSPPFKLFLSSQRQKPEFLQALAWMTTAVNTPALPHMEGMLGCGMHFLVASLVTV